jgi:hypothetical protein
MRSFIFRVRFKMTEGYLMIKSTGSGIFTDTNAHINNSQTANRHQQQQQPTTDNNLMMKRARLFAACLATLLLCTFVGVSSESLTDRFAADGLIVAGVVTPAGAIATAV